MPELADDVVIACADLAGRAGARDWAMEWTCPHVPDESDDHNCEHVTWNARVSYQGARITVERHRSPSAAALALAERLLSGATCRCKEPVALGDDQAGCRWRLVGKRWEPGCDAAPIDIPGGERGDMAAIQRAVRKRGDHG